MLSTGTFRNTPLVSNQPHMTGIFFSFFFFQPGTFLTNRKRARAQRCKWKARRRWVVASRYTFKYSAPPEPPHPSPSSATQANPELDTRHTIIRQDVSLVARHSCHARGSACERRRCPSHGFRACLRNDYRARYLAAPRSRNIDFPSQCRRSFRTQITVADWERCRVHTRPYHDVGHN
jgi:hypothetical protein